MFTDVTFGLFTFVNMEIAKQFLRDYSNFKVREIEGRFLSHKQLKPLLLKFESEFIIREIGRSFLNVPIEQIQIGTGAIKILAWSQMHGNETTTTKGILDLLNFFSSSKNQPGVEQLLEKITLYIIPMLNPDGAARYTRENVNKVDLNRDAYHLKEPESRVLRNAFEALEPDFCFNLHDQRTIFGVGDFPATLSFLAPSMDDARSVNEVRQKAMHLIVCMNQALQKLIPGQVGRFDDSYNINCSGDYFQSREVPTVLFECGHFPEDYQREETRRLFAYAFLIALESITSGNFSEHPEEGYFKIPENEKNFNDFVLRNGLISGKKVDVAIQFSEVMKAGEVNFLPKIEKISPELPTRGHQEINCNGGVLKNMQEQELCENDIVEVILLNKEKLSIKSP